MDAIVGIKIELKQEKLTNQMEKNKKTINENQYNLLRKTKGKQEREQGMGEMYQRIDCKMIVMTKKKKVKKWRENLKMIFSIDRKDINEKERDFKEIGC